MFLLIDIDSTLATHTEARTILITHHTLQRHSKVDAVCLHSKSASVCLQHCQHEPLSVKATVREDPRTHALCAALVACADDWSARAVGNVAWAHAVLHHGPDNLLELVQIPATESVFAHIDFLYIQHNLRALRASGPSHQRIWFSSQSG